MVHMQIQLTEDQYRRLKRWANRLGISLAEAVRRCIGDRLSREETEGGREDLVREALPVLGKYADPDGPSRVGRDHDDHLARAFRR